MCCDIPEQDKPGADGPDRLPDRNEPERAVVHGSGEHLAGLDQNHLATVAGLVANQLEGTAFVARAGAQPHRFYLVSTAAGDDLPIVPPQAASAFHFDRSTGEVGEPILVEEPGPDDPLGDEGLHRALPGHKHFLVMPVSGADGAMSGLLGAGHVERRPFSARDQNLLRHAARLISFERMPGPPPDLPGQPDRSRQLVDVSAESVRLFAAVSRVLVSGEAETISVQLDQVNDPRSFEIRMEPDQIGDPVTIVRDASMANAEQEWLALEADLLQTLIDLLPEQVYVKDTSSRFVRVNRAAFEGLGARAASEVIGTTDFDWFPEAVARDFFDQEQSLFATGVPIVDLIENQAVFNDSDRWRRTSKIPIRDHTGQVVGLVGSSWDVTESLANERVLAQLAALVEWSNDAIIGIDTNGRISSWNPEAARLFGYTAAEAVGQEYTMLVPPGEPMILYDDLLETRQGHYTGSLEARRRRRDGTLVEVEVTASLIRDALGEPAGVSTIIREIGARKEAEARLREMEFRYRTYVEQMPALTYIASSTGEPIRLPLGHLNNRWEEWSGYPVEEWDRDPDFTYTIMHPDDRDRVRALDDETAVSGAPYRAEFRIICRDGSISWVRDEAILIREDSGEPLFWLGFIVDITDLKRAEFDAMEALESLQEANTELEQVSSAKGEIVKLISHEFRTPLTSIQGYSELLIDETLTFDEVRQFATTINSNAKRLSRMIGDMLDIDRLESGRMELRWGNVDLNELVDDVLDTLRPTSPRHAFDTRLDPTLPLIHGDLDLLIRVVTNLVANAVKYSPAGGVVTLTTTQTVDTIELTVADQGLGIPEDALESIFARYTRIARPEQAHIEGTGLGLPIAREIVSLHGGSIWAESDPGHGSVLHVTLPK